MAAAVGRLLRGSVARHVNAISGGISAPTTLRPAACGRTHLMNILWSGSSPAFSTSSSYRAPAVTQHAPYFKGTAVVNGEFKDLSLDDFKGKYLVLFFYPLDFTFRGLFIIDPNGVIKHLSVNDLPVGRSVEETLRLVKAFQFVEAHGEVCPANWTPDSPTIKPNPTASKEYFEKVNQ
ncbi:thioredoxin-dependent peroxide reductase, mitochondrial [Otolemur garnettii]|uniref:thioredoxin-dependent peroxide reductase, mitochondrial n=1 Tax=Otolemur garnettii TaxID=30611 RepID=UPI000C7F35FB|nr:thioredoxin-dependent peroxide reductase, mitochondrial [Otolemur garnettii]